MSSATYASEPTLLVSTPGAFAADAKVAAGPNGSFELAMDAKKEELTNTPTFKSKREQDVEKLAEQQRKEAPQRPTGQKP